MVQIEFVARIVSQSLGTFSMLSLPKCYEYDELIIMNILYLYIQYIVTLMMFNIYRDLYEYTSKCVTTNIHYVHSVYLWYKVGSSVPDTQIQTTQNIN